MQGGANGGAWDGAGSGFGARWRDAAKAGSGGRTGQAVNQGVNQGVINGVKVTHDHLLKAAVARRRAAAGFSLPEMEAAERACEESAAGASAREWKDASLADVAQVCSDCIRASTSMSMSTRLSMCISTSISSG